MAKVSDKELLKAKDGYAPQYYNDDAGAFEVVTGKDGKMLVHDKAVADALKQVTEYVVIDSFVGKGEVSKRYSKGAYGVTVVNDGEKNVIIDVNSIEVIVKPYEVCEGLFNEFREISFNGDEYRVLIKGVKE